MNKSELSDSRIGMILTGNIRPVLVVGFVRKRSWVKSPGGSKRTHFSPARVTFHLPYVQFAVLWDVVRIIPDAARIDLLSATDGEPVI